jgi:dTDP-glucose pyrophosphorylase
MINCALHTLQENASIKEGLERLNAVNGNAVFIVNSEEKVVGTITDGDIRRGLIQGRLLSDPIHDVMHTNFRFIKLEHYSITTIDKIKEQLIGLLPVLDENGKLVKLLDLKKLRTVLPVEVLLMAGGRGERLRPLTDETPKPMLRVGSKPIIEHNIDRLALYGVERIHISVKYKADCIINHFGDGSEKGLNINYVREDEPLGTLGAARLIDEIESPAILVMNSDLLTNIDFEDFYRVFEESNADMIVACTSYRVDIPFGVLETSGNKIISLKEKPSYNYFLNAGIYLIKKEVLQRIEKGKFYNATDLLDELLAEGKKVLNYPIVHYWLDIGNPDDFKKAQEDIKQIHF